MRIHLYKYVVILVITLIKISNVLSQTSSPLIIGEFRLSGPRDEFIEIYNASASAPIPTVYYVKTTGNDANSGTSWATAFKTLQKALLTAGVSGDQIWVAAGTYYPDEGPGHTDNSPYESFILKNGVAIYGGFAGTETLLSQRNWNTNVTILSGDLMKNDLANFDFTGENAYHVVVCSVVDYTTVLDGVSVKGGNATHLYPDYRGGGVVNSWHASPTFSNCTFSENQADVGAAMWNVYESFPILNNCNFTGNKGRAMCNEAPGANLTPIVLTNCTFSGNEGGAISTVDVNLTLTNCSFLRNYTLQGGAIYNQSGSLILTNCIFLGNSGSGSGMYNSFSNPILTNCTFYGNRSLLNAGAIYNNSSSPILTNCILWSNGNGIVQNGGTSIVTYSIVEGGFIGTGNKNQDPLFVDAVNGNLHLQNCSPALNAGLNSVNTTTTDLDSNPRIAGNIIDMGAYEIQIQSCPPTVVINKAPAQADPTTLEPIHFIVGFDQTVTGFDGSDISFTGSTVQGTLVATVTGVGSTYDVSVTGMTSPGDVVASIPSAAAVNLNNIGNSASTSTDNTVTYSPQPSVTINKAAAQADPTSASPIHFTVTFSQPVTGFTSSDVSIVTDPLVMLLLPVVTVTGGPTVYDVAISGMNSSGTITVSIAAGVAVDAANQFNLASTSTDNSVVYNIPPCTVTCPSNITVAATSPSGAVVNYTVTPAGDCQNIVRVPAPTTTFPIGTTTVNAYNNVSTGLVYAVIHGTEFITGFSIDQLVTFNVNTGSPTTFSTPITITGTFGSRMVAIDFRPSNGQLYGLAVSFGSPHSIGRIYTINKSTGVATPLSTDFFNLSDAISFDMDFNPVTGILRVTDANGTNLRIDPDLGTVLASDPPLSAGFSGTAYSNTFPSSTFTTLYEINSLTNALYVQGGINGVPSPNTGSTTLVGSLGVDIEQEITGFGAFDISLSAGALATFLVDGGSKLYSINLSTGAATLIGAFNGAVFDIAIAPVTLPLPSCSFTVTVTPPAPLVTINQAATQGDPTSTLPIHFTVVFDQAVTGFDGSDVSFIGSTAPGTLVATVTGNGTTYDVAVSGMTSAGNVVASIPAGAAFNSSSQPNTASTSTDNVVFLSGIAPTITCPGNITVNAAAGTCGANVSLTGENAFQFTGSPILSIFYFINNGGDVRSGNLPSTPSTLNYAGGVNDVTLLVTNSIGSASCNFKVTVVDNQPPVLQCSGLTVNADPGLCYAILPYFISGFENCASQQHPVTISTSRGFSFSSPTPNFSTGTSSARGLFGIGTTTVVVRATDASGNTATCSYDITVIDNQKPVITNCPNPATVSCASQIPLPDISTVSAQDNCGSPTITHQGDIISNQSCVNKYTITRTYKATDGSGNTATCSQLITVDDNTSPTITGLTPSKQILAPPNHKMIDVSLAYTINDNCTSSPDVVVTITSNEPVNGTGDGDTDPDWEVIDAHHIRLRAERSAQGSGRSYTITVTVSDGCNAPVSATTEVMVVHNITGPHSGNSFRVGSTVALAGEFWDVPGNKHTAKWLIDGVSVNGVVTEPAGGKNGKVTGSYKFTVPGVYKLQMNITDQKGVTTYANTNGDLEAIVVIYDPNGGYTYGGGYYDSPAGALVANSSTTGKASYGFTMNYFKNATNPKGETQFEFKVGDFEFNALNFDYLVISNSMAQFKGTGKIIGGQSGVGFTMTVTDGQLDGTGIDKIRMKIYNKNTGKIIYDNQPGASDAAVPTQAVGTNSIIVISGTNSSLTSANTNQKGEMEANIAEVSDGLDVIAFPNPSATNFTINVKTNKTQEKIAMQVVDMYGRVIETRNVNANSIIRFGDRYGSGTYFVRIMQGKEHKEIKLIKLSD